MRITSLEAYNSIKERKAKGVVKEAGLPVGKLVKKK
jgi:hypothetical protein